MLVRAIVEGIALPVPQPAPGSPVRRWAVWAALIGAALAVAWTSPAWLAFNMDEFLHYHVLGCATAPLAQNLEAFRSRCGLYDLRLPFTSSYLPLRAYLYVGSLPALVFLPFWALFGAPVAARVQGAVFFVLAAALGTHLLRVRPLALVLASLVFPVYAFCFLVDEGPVGLSVALLLAALLVMRRGRGAGSAGAARAWGAVAGLLLFAGVWVKLVFVWWLPAALAYIWLEGRQEPAAARDRRRQVLVTGALALLLPTLALLAATDIEGRPYYATLYRARLSADPAQRLTVMGRLALYVTNASRVAPRNVSLPGSPLDALPVLAAIALVGPALRRGQARRRRVAFWMGCAAVTFLLVASSAHSRWAHHVVLALLFLILALAEALETVGALAMAATTLTAAFFWGSLVARWPRASVPVESDRSKDALLAEMRQQGLDRATVQVHASWGTYYIAQLFGARERMVLDDRALFHDRRRLRQVLALAQAHGRPLLIVSSSRSGRHAHAHLEAVLGPPERVQHFGSWRAILYR